MRPCPAPTVRSARRGYTVIEVLMAMTVMSIGAAAVMSMQRASVQGNLDARETDIANSIARTWVERLQKDAMSWTLPSAQFPMLNNFTNALLLSSPQYGQWSLPQYEMGQTNPETMSYAFDILGRDLPLGSINTTETVFCVNYRLQWLVPQAPPTEPGLIRADVRVLWQRGISNELAPGWCSAQNANLVNPDQLSPNPPAPVFHSIYLSTTIKEGGQ
jgi:prepilin-type N-terminal cleavage/methylation domain-containing protein